MHGASKAHEDVVRLAARLGVHLLRAQHELRDERRHYGVRGRPAGGRVLRQRHPRKVGRRRPHQQRHDRREARQAVPPRRRLHSLGVQEHRADVCKAGTQHCRPVLRHVRERLVRLLLRRRLRQRERERGRFKEWLHRGVRHAGREAQRELEGGAEVGLGIDGGRLVGRLHANCAGSISGCKGRLRGKDSSYMHNSPVSSH